MVFSATYDVKKSIGDIALNMHGSQIAIVENQGGYDSVEESAVRVYNVGRKRNEDNQAVSCCWRTWRDFFLQGIALGLICTFTNIP